MYRATFELEAITPVFMRGADQGKAEFRPASVKGVMRWWFRALAGAYLGNDIEKLREVEGRIFGSAGSGGSRRSNVRVRVDEVDVRHSSVHKWAENWWDKEVLVWSDYVDYLFFSALNKRRKMNKIEIKTRFNFIEPGSTFEITLTSPDETLLSLAAKSFWVAVKLGGFGFRARRGAGSFEIVGVDSDVEVVDEGKPLGENLASIVSYFEQTIPSICDDRKHCTPKKEGIPLYPWFSKNYTTVFRIGDGIPVSRNESWIEALNEFGRWYLGTKQGRKFGGGFRFRRAADYALSHKFEDASKHGMIINNVYDARRGERPPHEKRQYLGLPIRYANYSTTLSGYKGSVPKGERIDKSRIVRRRASGYWVSLIMEHNRLFPVVTVFAYQFYPDYRGVLYFSKKPRHGAKASGVVILPKENNSKAVEFYKEMVTVLETAGEKVWPLKEGSK